MIDVYISEGILHLVLEFCPYDLERVIRDRDIILRTHHVKSYVQMMLLGLKFLHEHSILHRGNNFSAHDLKVR